jgi:hypothetical protein
MDPRDPLRFLAGTYLPPVRAALGRPTDVSPEDVYGS